MDGIFIGPHTSEYSSSKIFFARVPPSLGNGCLACLPWTHPLHANECTSFGIACTSMPLTIVWSNFMLLALRCPNFLYQSSKGCELASKCAKEVVSTPCITFVSNWYKLDSNVATANISPLLALGTHPNELKCIFNPFDISLLTESKLAFKSGMWRTSCIWMLQARSFTRVSTRMDPLPTASIMPLSPVNTLRPEMGSYVSKNYLCGIMWLGAPESTIHIMVEVLDSPSLTTNAKLSLDVAILAFTLHFNQQLRAMWPNLPQL